MKIDDYQILEAGLFCETLIITNNLINILKLNNLQMFSVVTTTRC